MNTKLWRKAAQVIVSAGAMPFPVSDTLIEILHIKMTEEQANFILVFKRPSLNLDEIKKKSKLSEKEILEMLEELMINGIVSGSTSKSTGIKVYTLMPPFPGIIEFSLMKGGTSEKEKKLARLFDKLFEDLGEGTQRNYDEVMPQFKNFPAPDRVIPVEENIKLGDEVVLLTEEASKLVDEYDTIALAICYCRHQRDLVNDPCKVTDKREVCLIFSKAAEYSIKYGFAKAISKEKAKKVLKEAEDIGLVHKVFHSHLDIKKGIDGICNCCKCCCGIFRLYYEGVAPFHTLTSYIAKVLNDECVGCGTCVEKCQIEAISLENDIAVINEDKCIGCGVCAHLCPQDAIEILRTGPRDVFILPPKIKG